ncbi:MAG: hypothetical protein R3E87_01440 [Burkholderiaceae bacterium]
MSQFRQRAATMIAIVGLAVAAQSAAAADISKFMASEVEKLKQEWAANPVLIEAVLAQNAKHVPLTSIQDLDAKWQATPGLADFMMPILDNPAAAELYKLEANAGYVVESFVMDDQGALVAATNKTSDYWQGDEDKFTESYKGGNGAVHVSAVKFDASAQKHLAQVSLPIMKDGKAIGAITLGVDVGAVR